VEATRACPDCTAEIPVLAGFPDWCEHCGWNVRAPAPPWTSDHPFDRIRAALGRRAGESVARRLIATRELRPRWTPARAAAYAIAALVVLTGAACFAGGVAALLAGGINPVTILIAALGFGLGWLLRPRLHRLDRTWAVQPEQAPELHALAADIAAALGRRPPDVLAVTPEFNAHWVVAGLLRRRMLALGAPLLAVLRAPERVALIAHEIGHDRNGDARRGVLVGGAVDALAALHDAMVPHPSTHRIDHDVLDAAAPLARAVQRIAALPVLGLLTLEAQLLFRDSRRAEYFADGLAAEVAGTSAVVALHERLLLWSTYKLAVQHAVHERNDGALFDRLRAAFGAVPAREHARRRAVARLETTRLNDTHPPTGMRIALLEGRPQLDPAIVLDSARNERIDRELAALEPVIAASVLDRERGLLYSG
jgi:Zn-dependent protease with chaperone function